MWFVYCEEKGYKMHRFSIEFEKGWGKAKKPSSLALATWRENNPKIAENLTVVKGQKDATSYIIHDDAKGHG